MSDGFPLRRAASWWEKSPQRTVKPFMISTSSFQSGALRVKQLLAVTLCAAIATGPVLAAESFSLPPKDSPELAWWCDSMTTREARLEWWREARFGMFVHWGVYAALGNEYKGRKGGGYAEHIQRVLKIPIPEYRREVAGIFNPTNFNADEWIRAAKHAGMGYFVITSKHHDGFAMWPSAVNDYNLTNCTPFKRDVMMELRAACKKHGVRFGFYYSHAFDWGTSNGPGNDWEFDNPGGDKLLGGRNWWETRPEFLPKAREYVDTKSIPQLQELVKRYDPDIFWFDTPSKLPDSENLRILKAVRTASARVVINGRLVRGMGDYASTADRPAEFPPQEGDWEGIPTTNESYAWSKTDNSHKPVSHFIQLIAKAAARGGNTLMNIGPMGDGRIDPKDLAILEGIGNWWQVNGESIRGTERTPLPVQAWGESTRKGNTLYLHVFNWPKDGQLVVGGLKSDVKKAYLLGDAKRSALELARMNPLDVVVAVPSNASDASDSVVVLECDGTIQTDTTRLLQPAFAGDTLRVFDGDLKGAGLRFGPGKVRDAYVTGLSKPGQSIAWAVRLNAPATFEVSVIYDADAPAAGRSFGVELGAERLGGAVKPGTFQTNRLGRVTLQSGLGEIGLAPVDSRDGELMRPRSLTLTPVR
jgi:alpha-L-fucosidase